MRPRNHGLGAVAAIHLAIGRHAVAVAVAVAVEHPGTWAKEWVKECECKLHTQWAGPQAVVQSGSATSCHVVSEGCRRLSKD